MSRADRTGRAPYRKNLSREVVVREAMALLDEEGIEALTMRGLAERLDVVPNALYRHVRDKEDLLDAVLDLAVSLVPVPDPALDWRTGLAALATGIRTTMLEHPSSGRLVVSRPALGPHGLALGSTASGSCSPPGSRRRWSSGGSTWSWSTRWASVRWRSPGSPSGPRTRPWTRLRRAAGRCLPAHAGDPAERRRLRGRGPVPVRARPHPRRSRALRVA